MKKLLLVFSIAIFGIVNAQTVTIPVVFHVVYSTAGENIPDSVLIQQLNVLNQSYGADTACTPQMWDSAIAATQIQFCLAQTDPQGNSTTGITRTQTIAASFSMSGDPVKFNSSGGKNIWDRNNYLNIWVCDLSSGLLGYAQFPGGNATTDGVVMDYQYVGITGATAPYNLGKQCVHEVAHWLNLRHLICTNCGDDCDSIPDTPTYTTNIFTCLSGSDPCNPIPNIFQMNYMWYNDDACLCFFTPGQKQYMMNTLNTTRASLLSASACLPVSVSEIKNESLISVFPNPFSIQTTLHTDNLLHNATLTIYNCYGQTVREEIINNQSTIINRGNLSSGLYFYKAIGGKGQGTSEAIATGKLVITDK